MSRQPTDVWDYSLLFLDTFKELTYHSLSIPFLLLRQFQGYLLHQLGTFPHLIEWKGSKEWLQDACQPHFVSRSVSTRRGGYTLLRAQLHPLASGKGERQLLYLAHHDQEYRTVTQQGIHSLYYLDQLPEAKDRQGEEERIWQQLEQIMWRRHTPACFKSVAFKSWFLKQLPLCLRRVRQVRHLFQQHSISEVIYGSTLHPIGVIVTEVAKTMGAFTVNIQHGLLGEIGHLPANADLHLVWDEAQKRFLRSYGVPGEQIQIIPPLFIRDLEPNSPPLSLERWAQGETPLRILVALQPLGIHFNQQMIQLIETALSPFSKRVQLTYRLHPDQKQSRAYEKLIRDQGAHLLKDSDAPLSQLLVEADLLITTYSTVAYQAILTKRPVLYYGPERPIYYLEEKPLFFNSWRRLRLLIRRMLNQPHYLARYRERLRLSDQPDLDADPFSSVWQVLDRKRSLHLRS